MAYVRKTRDEFEIQSRHANSWDLECAEETYREARNRLREYLLNVPGVLHRIQKKRVKVQACEK